MYMKKGDVTKKKLEVLKNSTFYFPFNLISWEGHPLKTFELVGFVEFRTFISFFLLARQLVEYWTCFQAHNVY